MEVSVRRRLPHGRWADAAIVVLAVVIVVVATVVSEPRPGAVLPPWLGWPLQLAACAALFWRRRHPQAVVAVTLVAVMVYYPLSGQGSPVFGVVMVALYSLAASGRLRASIVWAAVILAVTIGSQLVSPVRHLDDIALVMLTGWCVATVAVGVVVHDRAALLAETRRRAAETALREAAQDRLRVAREVHDVVGHHLSLINVQAAAALHRIHKDPSQAESALATIKTTSGDTLGELRRTLAVLRQPGEAAPTEPTAGLAEIETLFDGLRAAGVEVDYRIAGTARPLPVEVELAGYRIVQEALTNVVKHAGATRATVRLLYSGTGVTLDIADDGTAEPTDATGHGIAGMTERARGLGGELSAGPRPAGGFGVHANLPAPEPEDP